MKRRNGENSDSEIQVISLHPIAVPPITKPTVSPFLIFLFPAYFLSAINYEPGIFDAPSSAFLIFFLSSLSLSVNLFPLAFDLFYQLSTMNHILCTYWASSMPILLHMID